MSCNPETQPLLRFNDEVERTSVFPIIVMIRSDVMFYIDTPLTHDALTAPDLTYTVIRPLVDKYTALQNDGNMSIVFCCLLNRIHFLRDDNLATASLSNTRALLCEILASRLFKQYGNDMLSLARVLTTIWPVYNGADPRIVRRAREERDGDLDDRVGNAIELAILGKAKGFIKSPACQKVIDAIWSGKCVYQAESSHAILSDTYKRTPIHFYDPHKAPLLDHYRLKVPSIRAVLEYVNFLTLFILFVVALEYSKFDRINMAELLFMIFALGFTLEKVAAMQEHGIKVYFKGTWNGFDVAFITLYCIYASLRLYGVNEPHSRWARALGIDFLALIACLMFPRLAFVTLKDNLMVLSLRAMTMQFLFLMVLAAFCFCGFLYALWTLSRNKAGYDVGTIAWWMLDLYFGLDATGFNEASSFHPVFGPMLMVIYACMSNTLLLTVLVSILTNTFANISEDAPAEAMFRKAVSTIEGVKADFVFSYQPPINLLALCVLLPASYVLSPRWFHKVNVFLIRLTNFPFLLLIALYERQSKQAGTVGFSETIGAMFEKALARHIKHLTIFEGLAGSDSDIDAIFEVVELVESQSTQDDQYPLVQRPRRKSIARPARSRSPAPVNPRLRVNSLRQADSAAPSPLAQLYHVLTADEDIFEESDEDGNATLAPNVASYGPRRRLASIAMAQRRNIPDPNPNSSPKHFPVMGGDRLSPNAALSESPQSLGNEESKKTDNLATIDIHKKLADIETRHRRMEELLNVIAQKLQ
ncbi:hypothetical protein M378DRAFT_21449 [Amanita muscaria Koide BX008]|uniref:Uncharacterized protein n=1 Tax=Amanita muscaria (strain Koide BX008) TaxID=946122 RepID=A0A0C2T0C7_AMAMK|nr:hypothetical protein M378DRAFT_21449 [Amanita muscaria Koide BX008]